MALEIQKCGHATVDAVGDLKKGVLNVWLITGPGASGCGEQRNIRAVSDINGRLP
jgi:hypothetical protein